MHHLSYHIICPKITWKRYIARRRKDCVHMLVRVYLVICISQLTVFGCYRGFYVDVFHVVQNSPNACKC